MGYTTIFDGQISVEPPLNPEEITYLNKFADTRRMACEQGPYYIDRGGFCGENPNYPGIFNYNTPPEGRPSLWCDWVPTEDGGAIEWNGAEKFHDADEWMQYLIDHFIGSSPHAKAVLPFLQGHTLNGEIDACGDDPEDRWKLIVEDNRVFIGKGSIVYGEPQVISV
jgi:hypothetical protein